MSTAPSSSQERRSRPTISVPIVVVALVALSLGPACGGTSADVGDGVELDGSADAPVNAPVGDASIDGARDAAKDGASSRDAGGDAALSPTYSGQATYYNADGTGACGFPASPNDLLVAAMNQAQYSKSVCGKCAHVDGPHGSVTVRIVDLCPGCNHGGLDLSEQAFAAISPLSAGRVNITWYFTPCP